MENQKEISPYLKEPQYFLVEVNLKAQNAI
jgi:hypothetical protein